MESPYVEEEGNMYNNSWSPQLESPGAATEDSRVSALEVALQHMQQEKIEATRTRMRAVITRIFEDPFTKNKKVILLKAWVRWSKILPLNLKCDELALQLQDRIVAFSSLRDSYYRDVVSVKLHMEKVANFKFEKIQNEAGKKGSEEGKVEVREVEDKAEEAISAAKKLQADLYSVHALPNINFQTLLDRARVTGESSTQLKENLLQAGLINVTTGKMFNPWEKSKAFNRIMKQKKGSHFKPPKTDGECIASAVPQTHELFIKYCKSCIGVMQFTRTWNAEVEHSMHMTSVTNAMEKEIADLKYTIVNLSQIVQKQELQIFQLEAEKKKLKDAGDWMGKWTYQQETLERESDLHAEIKSLKVRQGMLSSDLEATMVEFASRQAAEHDRAALREARLNSRLAKEVAAKDEERQQRMLMLETLSVSEKAGAEKDDIIAKLRAENSDQRETIISSREAIGSLTRINEELSRLVDEWTSKYENIKQKSEQEIDDMRFEMDANRRELEDKNGQLDSLYTQIREDRSVKNRLQARCDEFDEMKRKEALHQVWLASRPKYKLRTIALVVKIAVRLSRAIAAGTPFYGAGALGRRLQVRLIHESYKPTLAELAACKETISIQDLELKKATKEIGELTYKNNTAQAALATVRDQYKGLQAICTELRGDIKNREDEITKLETGALAYCKKIDQIKRVLHRQRISSHMQRVLLRLMSRNLTRIHGVLRSFTPERLPVLPPYIAAEDLARQNLIAGVGADAPEDGSLQDAGSLAAGSIAEASITSLKLVNPLDQQDVGAGGAMMENVGETEEERAAREAAIAAAKAVRRQELKSRLRAGLLALVKWLKSAAKDRPFEATNFRLPDANKETVPEYQPNKDFEKHFKETSKKLLTVFVDERKKIDRQIELALSDARNASTFASTARQMIARFHKISNELQACKQLIQDMRDAEMLRLRKEAKAQRKAEAKRRKEEEKLARLKAKQSAKQASRKGSTRGGDKSIKVNSEIAEVALAQPSAAGGDGAALLGDDQSAGEESTAAADIIVSSSQAGAQAPNSTPQSGSAFVPKPAPKSPGFMSMNYGNSAGGGAPSGKAKQEVDLSFLDRPDREPMVKKVSAAVVFSDTEDDEDDSDGQESVNAEMEIIEQLEEEVHELQVERSRLIEQLEAARLMEEQLNGKIDQKENAIQGLQADLRLSRLDVDAAKQRIRLLRDAIEDNYRQRSAEIEEIRRTAAEEEIKQLELRRASRRHRGTQIACAVCAIRTHGIADADDNVGEHISLDTCVTVNEGFVEPLQGEFVLMARPKSINTLTTHEDKERQDRDSRHKIRGSIEPYTAKANTATTQFSDVRPSQSQFHSQALSQSIVDPHVGHAQEIAYALSRSKAQVQAQQQEYNSRPSAPKGQRGDSLKKPLAYGSSPQTVNGNDNSDFDGETSAKRPQTTGGRLYQPGVGYDHSRGHTLHEDDLALPKQLQMTSMFSAGEEGENLPSGTPLNAPSATQGVRDAYEVRRTDTNTAAFLQQQLLDGLKQRPKSSIPSVRQPAPPLGSLVHKRQLAPVPSRSQSASELIMHLRHHVASAGGAGPLLVEMGRRYQDETKKSKSQRMASVGKRDKSSDWNFIGGDFEHHTGHSVELPDDANEDN